MLNNFYIFNYKPPKLFFFLEEFILKINTKSNVTKAYKISIIPTPNKQITFKYCSGITDIYLFIMQHLCCWGFCILLAWFVGDKHNILQSIKISEWNRSENLPIAILLSEFQCTNWKKAMGNMKICSKKSNCFNGNLKSWFDVKGTSFFFYSIIKSPQLILSYLIMTKKSFQLEKLNCSINDDLVKSLSHKVFPHKMTYLISFIFYNKKKRE